MAQTEERSPENVLTMPVGETLGETNQPSESLDEAIARRAYELYCARGCEDGHDVDDWLNAERELRAERSATSAA